MSFILLWNNISKSQADTGIDGNAMSSSGFSIAGMVTMSSLTVTSQIIANVHNSTITLQGIAVDSLTVNNVTTMNGAVSVSTMTISSMTVKSGTFANATIGNSATNSVGYLTGTIVQMIQFIDTTTVNSSGTSMTATNTKATITPKSSTDKIKISVIGTLGANNIVTSTALGTIFRGTTNLDTTNLGFISIVNGSGGTPNPLGIIVPASMVYVDSPATTSAVTYTAEIQSSSVAGAARWNAINGSAVILLEEIAN